MSPSHGRLLAAVAGLVGLTLLITGCIRTPSTPTARTPTPTSRATPAPGPDTGPDTSASPSATVSITEPTTTNTLPPPPEPSRPAPSTAGPLTARALPSPTRWPGTWRTVARKGGAEEGFAGNGTWVHARDPRYAATDAITMGCSQVTRDDFSDPIAALEGSYTDGKQQPGVGLALQFRTAAQATTYYRRYLAQLRSCQDPSVLLATVIDSQHGLIDRRHYPDGDWTEVGKLSGDRLTLLLLTDPGHRLSTADAETILATIPG